MQLLKINFSNNGNNDLWEINENLNEAKAGLKKQVSKKTYETRVLVNPRIYKGTLIISNSSHELA